MNKNTDKDLAFLEMMLCAMSGESPSRAIENQEKRGQEAVVRGQRLPKKANAHTVPSEIRFRGVSNDMPYDERQEIVDHNIYEYTKEQYEKMGIGVGRDYDDLFWSVSLPVGWEIKATDHTMWNELIDDKGRKRGTFFYKAAFYDRNAFINFETRYKIESTHIADSEEDYEVWSKSDHVGYVKDGDTILYQTELIPAIDDFSKDYEIDRALYAELEKYMAVHYPEWEDTQAYWD